MRDYILKHYLKRSPKSVIVWHHGSIHLRNFFLSLVFSALLWVFYSLLHHFFPLSQAVVWVSALGALIIYLRFLFTFFDLYLDAVVIDDSGVSLFLWNKVFNYSVQYCHRDHIEDIRQSQETFADKFFQRGDITLTLNNGTILHFSHIAHPKKVATLLRNQKIKFESPRNALSGGEVEGPSWEKFTILVETLGEVIKDYMDRDKNKLPDRPEDRPL